MREHHGRLRSLVWVFPLWLGAVSAAGGCGDPGPETSDDLVPGWTPNPVPPVVEAACGAAPAGRKVGDLVEDFELRDQNGSRVQLSDYCGKVVYIALGAMWCTECIHHAEAIPELVADFGDESLVVLTVMTENPDFDPPSQKDLETWAKSFDLSSPVLGDDGWRVWDRYYRYHAAPGQLLIGRDGRIRKKLSFDSPHEVTAADVEAAVSAQ
jgi:peroxiredoxin